jgi:hypothetical protein
MLHVSLLGGQTIAEDGTGATCLLLHQGSVLSGVGRERLWLLAMMLACVLGPEPARPCDASADGTFAS